MQKRFRKRFRNVSGKKRISREDSDRRREETYECTFDTDLCRRHLRGIPLLRKEPDSGTVEIGQTVKLGYFSQENEAMDESLKVIDYIRNAAEYVKIKDGSISASQMLERFYFRPVFSIR